VPRPPDTRKMNDRTLRQAAASYRKGESLKVVAGRFGVDASTLAREPKRGGVQIRLGRGWLSPG
jgi:transposase